MLVIAVYLLGSVCADLTSAVILDPGSRWAAVPFIVLVVTWLLTNNGAVLDRERFGTTGFSLLGRRYPSRLVLNRQCLRSQQSVPSRLPHRLGLSSTGHHSALLAQLDGNPSAIDGAEWGRRLSGVALLLYGDTLGGVAFLLLGVAFLLLGASETVIAATDLMRSGDADQRSDERHARAAAARLWKKLSTPRNSLTKHGRSTRF